jgi:hypothetical protein
MVQPIIDIVSASQKYTGSHLNRSAKVQDSYKEQILVRIPARPFVSRTLTQSMSAGCRRGPTSRLCSLAVPELLHLQR